MKNGLTLQDLAAELTRQNAAKRDYRVDTRELTLLTPVSDETGAKRPSELYLPGGEVPEMRVNENAHRQIGTHLKMPARYYDMLRADHPGLLDRSVNTLFRERQARRTVRALDFGDGDPYVRAFLSERYRRLDNHQLAEAVLPVLGEIPDVVFPSCQITDDKMYITALAPRTEAEVKVGDVVQAGVRITNSEVGAGALKVEPLIYRLICTNGMVVAKPIRKFHVGRVEDNEETLRVLSDETLRKDDEAFFAKMADVVRDAVSEVQFESVVAQLREAMTGQKIEKPIQAMEALQDRYSLSDGEKESVFSHLISGGDLSAFGTLNAVTRAAQDVESYDRSMELEQVGGAILEIAGTPAWERIAVAA
jgi:hypothetical protein